MLGLRTKLLLGLAGLLLTVLVTSILGETVMERYSVAIQRSYREDYDSVAACQRMKELIGRLDMLAQGALWHREPDRGELQQVRSSFEFQLNMQRQAATLPGEREATEELASLWSIYNRAYPAVLDASAPEPQRREAYLNQLYPASSSIHSSAQRLIDMNLSALLAVPGKAQAATRHAHWAMRTLTLSGLALAILSAALIGRIILRPIRALTLSAHAVERGNFDLSVPVRAHDELGALAMAFNTMAGKLREYQQIARERLVRTERTTQLAIDSLPDVVLVTNPQGEVELANAAARQLLPGAAGGEFNLSRLPSLARLRQRIANAEHAAELSDYESTVQLERDGEIRHFLPRTVPIRDDAGKVVGATVVLADVTGLRRLDEMKNGLLSLVSHELKTPLTSARMILHLLPDQRLGPLTARQLDLLTAARDDIDRLHQIIESLLDMSRIESGRALMECQQIGAGELVRRSLEPLAGVIEGQQIEMRLELDAPLPPVMADATRIGHVFANLLMNALRHTPAGGRITVAAHRLGDMVEFAVQDSGSGIPTEYLPRVFEKFFRVPGQGGGSGSGIGLAIAKDIVEAHGGRIRVSSTEGAGSTFAFTLRCAAAADAPPNDSSELPDPPALQEVMPARALHGAD